MTKEETKQTVKEAAIEARMASAETLTTYGTHTSLDDFEYLSHDEIAEAAFVKGTEWQAKQSPWISVEERLPENQDIVLVRGEYGGKATAYLHGKDSGFIVYGEDAYKVFGEVTHWMPIPDLEE